MGVTRREVVNAIEGLLSRLEKYKVEDIPETCGACGTPAGNCDTNCMDAAHMSAQLAAIDKAEKVIEKIKSL